MKALIISDGKPGHFNQSIAFCKNTGIDYDWVDVRYRNRAAKALSYVLDRLGICAPNLLEWTPRGAMDRGVDLILSAGSTTFYPNKVLAKQWGRPNVAILHPKGYRLDFDLVLCPAYDHPPVREQIVELPLNLCAADALFFEEKTKEFSTKHAPKRPAVGFIIGGPNAVSTLDAVALKRDLECAFALSDDCEHWVTTSRRTPPAVEALIESMPFDYTLINSRDSYNPVPAFIQLCDRLFVTSDSASMISEATSFGRARVEILQNHPLKTPNKFEELLDGLERRGALHRFDGTLGDAHRKIDLKPLLNRALKRILKSNS